MAENPEDADRLAQQAARKKAADEALSREAAQRAFDKIKAAREQRDRMRHLESH